MNRRRKYNTRGSAMTELMICMMPYCMVILGVVLLGHLALGRQEIHKSVAWASPKPDTQTLAEVNDLFFKGVGGDFTAEFSEQEFTTEESMASYLAASEAEEEPVLPYDTQDIAAAVSNASVNISHSTSVVDGEVSVDVTTSVTQAGSELEKAGFATTGGVSDSQNMGTGELGSYAVDFPVNEEMCADLAMALGGWLKYSRSESRFRYKLSTGELRSINSENDNEEDTLLKDFQLGGDSNDPDRFAFYSTSVDVEGARGSHIDDTIDMTAFLDISPPDGESPATPEGYPDALMDINDGDKLFWGRTTTD